MTDDKLPKRWQKTAATIKAIQWAFDLDNAIQNSIRIAAVKNGLTPSDQIRNVLSLEPKSSPKRPRISFTLSENEIQQLAEQYHLPADDTTAIKARVTQTLIDFALNHKDK